MKILKTKIRLLLCIIIIATFFMPCYNNLSGFGFISYAFSEAKISSEMTETDVWIGILPLLSIPFSALIILIRSAGYLSIRKIYLALPLLFMLFFFGILLFSASGGDTAFSSSKILFQMQFSFYIAALASVILIFTKTYKKRRRRKKTSSSSSEIAVAA